MCTSYLSRRVTGGQIQSQVRAAVASLYSKKTEATCLTATCCCKKPVIQCLGKTPPVAAFEGPCNLQAILHHQLHWPSDFSNRPVGPVSWHRTLHGYSRPPSPQPGPRCRNGLLFVDCVPKLSGPWWHSAGKTGEGASGGAKTASRVALSTKCTEIVTSSKLASNFTAFWESTKTTGVAIASLRLFPNQRWFMSACKREQCTVICQMGKWL